MLGIMLPSSSLVLLIYRWREQYQQSPYLKAFSVGMVPITIGLMFATGWLLSVPSWQASHPERWLLLIAVTTWASWRKKINPLWLMLLGAALGAAMA
jgi:chromate transporter